MDTKLNSTSWNAKIGENFFKAHKKEETANLSATYAKPIDVVNERYREISLLSSETNSQQLLIKRRLLTNASLTNTHLGYR